jgi:hypothetical protein
MRVKLAWLVRVGGARPPPFNTFTLTSKVAVYAPAEWADTLTLVHLYQYMYSVDGPMFGSMGPSMYTTSLVLVTCMSLFSVPHFPFLCPSVSLSPPLIVPLSTPQCPYLKPSVSLSPSLSVSFTFASSSPYPIRKRYKGTYWFMDFNSKVYNFYFPRPRCTQPCPYSPNVML